MEVSLLAASQCAVCQEKLGSQFFWMKSPALVERQPVCVECAKLKASCAICQIPVKPGAFKLEDGRTYCPSHARDIVLARREAEEIFTETKREVIRILRGCGTLPNLNVRLGFVDQQQMNALAKEVRRGREDFTTVGLTRTFRDGDEFSHTVYLLNGQTRAGLMAAGAHEYTHTWLNENVPLERKLDANTVEGFCELVAYKVVSDLQHQAEKQIILSNAYTRGQIDAFIEAEDANRFYQIVQWMKSGVGDRMKSVATGNALELQKPNRNLSPFWPKAAPTPVPDTLQLKGVSGGPGRWMALINNQTFGAGEMARVRVGTSNVLVRCLAITEKAAMIELAHSGERKTLELAQH